MNQPKMKQSGAVLVVSLVILLILTILGVSVMRTTTLEEKMAAATRNKDLALQAAEAALRAAEDDINDGLGAKANDASTYYWPILAANAQSQRLNDNTICGGDIWSCAGSRVVPVAEFNSDVYYAKEPRYFIEEYLTSSSDDFDSINQHNSGEAVISAPTVYYRITAIGYGGTSDAQVVLQTTYGK